MNFKSIIKTNITLLLFLSLFTKGFAQKRDSLKTPSFFSGVITATNNGISLLPNLSLNKPAILFDLSIGKGRLSFDPMFRFQMNGKPWGFILWWRYRLIHRPKFKMSAGLHPAFIFREIPLTSSNGITQDYFITQRNLAGEITPTYYFNPKFGIGIHYLPALGLSKYGVRETHFLALRGLISNLHLGKKMSASLIPQFYYLKMDAKQGFYANVNLFLNLKNSPWAVSSIVSQALETAIAGKELVWNIGLNYNFNQKYFKK